MKVLNRTIPALPLFLLLAAPAFSQQTAPAPAAPDAASPAAASVAGASDCKSLRQKALLTGSAEGVRLLGEAQAVCRKAQQALSREQQPVPWAIATVDLANVTTDRAVIGANVQGLDEAVGLYRQALAVLSAETTPDLWAAAQMNLGSALQSRGIRTPGEAGVTYLQESADRLRQALRLLDAKKDPQSWAETQNNLGLVLAELGTRKGKPAGTALLEEAFQVFNAVQTVYTLERQPLRWSETRFTQARVLLALEKFDEAAPLLQEVTEKGPDNRRAVLTYASLLAGRLARPSDAASLTGKWIERHPEDLEIQVLHLEHLFAAGRLAESRMRAVSLAEKGAKMPPAVRIPLMGYEIATGLATGTKDAPDRLGALITLVQAQPQDFRIAGNFAGSLRFLQARPDVRNSDWQVELFHALQNRNGRDAILADLQKLENEMLSEPPVPPAARPGTE